MYTLSAWDPPHSLGAWDPLSVDSHWALTLETPFSPASSGRREGEARTHPEAKSLGMPGWSPRPPRGVSTRPVTEPAWPRRLSSRAVAGCDFPWQPNRPGLARPSWAPGSWGLWTLPRPRRTGAGDPTDTPSAGSSLSGRGLSPGPLCKSGGVHQASASPAHASGL